MLAIAEKKAHITLHAQKVHTAQNCIHAAPTFADANEEKMEALLHVAEAPTTETEVQTLDHEKEDALECTKPPYQDVPEAPATDVHSADPRQDTLAHRYHERSDQERE